MSFQVPNISSFSIAGLKNAADELRAQVYPKNETERKVYEALSSKNWGASTSLMGDIAQETYEREKYTIIMDIIWNSLETEGRSWKQLYKSLTLIDFLIKQGSERVVEDCRDHLRMIRPLTNYNFWEDGTDKGAGVCDKAKQIIELLNDNARIRTEREKCSKLRNKLVGISNDGNRQGGGGGYGGSGFGGGGSGGYGNSGIGSDYRNNGGYGNSGIGSESSRGSGGRDNSRSPYGGGTYDSNNPNRFSDDSTSNNDNTGIVNKTYDSSLSRNRDTWTEAEPAKASSGKLRVAIKPTGGAPQAPVHEPTPAAEVNFFENDDFMSAPAQPVASAPPAFDPFGDSISSAPVPTVPTVPAFDPFASAPPVPPQQLSGHDPFGGAPPAIPQQSTSSNNNNDPFGMSGNRSGVNGGYGGMNNNNLNMTGNMNMSNMNNGAGGNSMGMMNGGHNSSNWGSNNAVSIPQARSLAPPANPDDEDFGGFETAPSVSAPVTNVMKGGFGGLVDMDNFKVSANVKAPATVKKSDGLSTTSFNGIDGMAGNQQQRGIAVGMHNNGGFGMSSMAGNMNNGGYGGNMNSNMGNNSYGVNMNNGGYGGNMNNNMGNNNNSYGGNMNSASYGGNMNNNTGNNNNSYGGNMNNNMGSGMNMNNGGYNMNMNGGMSNGYGGANNNMNNRGGQGQNLGGW